MKFVLLSILNDSSITFTETNDVIYSCDFSKKMVQVLDLLHYNSYWTKSHGIESYIPPPHTHTYLAPSSCLLVY